MHTYSSSNSLGEETIVRGGLFSWWMTETVVHFLVDLPCEKIKSGSMARPFPDIEVGILDEIRIFVRDNMAAHLAPKEIEMMGELPKTTISGKILHRELKQMEIEKTAAGNIIRNVFRPV